MAGGQQTAFERGGRQEGRREDKMDGWMDVKWHMSLCLHLISQKLVIWPHLAAIKQLGVLSCWAAIRPVGTGRLVLLKQRREQWIWRTSAACGRHAACFPGTAHSPVRGQTRRLHVSPAHLPLLYLHSSSSSGQQVAHVLPPWCAFTSFSYPPQPCCVLAALPVPVCLSPAHPSPSLLQLPE